MLRLIEWLDLRYIFGPKRPFVTRLGALLTIAVLSTSIIGGMRNPERIVSRTPELPIEKADYVRGESLFRGLKPKAHVETLADAQRCLAQAIYFEARSEPVAGWEAVADVVINRASRPNIRVRFAAWCFKGNIAAINANFHLPVMACQTVPSSAFYGAKPCAWRAIN